jgi:hypothetical protein
MVTISDQFTSVAMTGQAHCRSDKQGAVFKIIFSILGPACGNDIKGSHRLI